MESKKTTEMRKKITIVKINFSRLVYNLLKDNKTVKLSYTVKEFFLFIIVLGNLHNIPDNAEANRLKILSKTYKVTIVGHFSCVFMKTCFVQKKK